MTFAQALAALDARTNYESSGRLVSPSLDRMRALCDLLAQPQASYPSVHVTGTNGKTTVARIATELLRSLGLAVGTYTSPHLHDVCERMTYDARPISEQDFAETYEYLEPFLKEVDGRGTPLTWFETITALAQVWFAERSVDVAVVEVGMGGEWDATNLHDGRVAVVTDVALDHPELGSTPAEIATEKSGIVKHGAVCVTAASDPAVLDVLRRRCGQVGATMRRFGVDYSLERRGAAIGGQTLEIRVGEQRFTDLFLPLFGEALGRDAAVALAAVLSFVGDRAVEPEAVREAFAAVRDPGRVEVLQRHPLIVADGAHNPAAAGALADAMHESFQWDRLVAVAGILADKDLP
ncbi:MAG: bifunctional folylpolyglutamate synthase/dihydrofolate synthase, partial [Actinomycetota bacterium]